MVSTLSFLYKTKSAWISENTGLSAPPPKCSKNRGTSYRWWHVQNICLLTTQNILHTQNLVHTDTLPRDVHYDVLGKDLSVYELFWDKPEMIEIRRCSVWTQTTVVPVKPYSMFSFTVSRNNRTLRRTLRPKRPNSTRRKTGFHCQRLLWRP